MIKILEKYKSFAMPVQIFVGILIISIIIGLAKSGYLIGVWLKTIL